MKRIFILLLALLGLLGLTWCASKSVNENLVCGARDTLRSIFPASTHPDLDCRFTGQVAQPTGTVHSQSEKDQLISVLSNQVRTPAHWWMFGKEKTLNPVCAVDASALRVAAVAPGWIAMASLENRVRVDGQVPSSAQEQALKTKIMETIGSATPLDWQVSVTDQVSAEPQDISTTIQSVPNPLHQHTTDGSYHLALLGKPFTQPLFAKGGADIAEAQINQELEAQRLTPVTLAAFLNDCRAYKKTQDQIKALPSSHLDIVAYGKQVFLSGEVRSEKIKQQVLASANQHYAPLTVLDGLRVSDRRRPVDELGLSLSSWPSAVDPLSPGLLAFDLPGSAWLSQPIPATGLKAGDLQNLPFLPQGFDSQLLGDDFARHFSGISEHLLSLQKPEPTPPTVPTVETGAPIWFIGTAKEVVLRGLVPNVEVIQALQGAAQKIYPDAKIINDLTVSPSAPAVTDITRTLYFPDMPEIEEDGQVGVALLGENWASRPLYGRQVFDADALQKQGLLPEGNAALVAQLHDISRLWKPQITSGPEEDSYIAMVASAGKLRVTGEVTDEATRRQVLEHIHNKWPTWKIDSDIHVVVGAAKAKSLEKTLRSIPEPPEERTTSLCAQALLDEEMRVNLVHSIYFRTGVSGFSNDGERAIRQMKKILEMMPNARFEMIGHTDTVGKLDYNQKLSQDRAHDFRAYAVKHGISDAIITNEGRGPHDPLRDNATDAGKAKNRRVDILLK